MFSTMLLSGGVGSRSGQDIPKQYCCLLGKMIIEYCLESISGAGLTDELVIVYGDGYLELLKNIMIKYSHIFKTVKYVEGGSTRQESVFNGLRQCSSSQVLLHEAARPLITADDILLVINHPSDAVTMGLDIPFTVLKQKDGFIDEVLERNELFNVQLPQKFNTKDLLKAHIKSAEDKNIFTDDSSLFFTYNGQVAVITGSHENIKITTQKDFTLAEEILKSRKI